MELYLHSPNTSSRRGDGKGKVVSVIFLSLSTTPWESGSVAPRILNLGTR
jgi:hypothetical protein